MTNQLKYWQQQFLGTPVGIAIASLFLGLIIQAFTPILTRLSESELSPNVAMFNRFWITLAIVGLWNGLQIAEYRQPDKEVEAKPPYTTQVVWLLLAMGTMGGTAMLLWAWSLTQTSIANSALAFSMTPLFSCFLEWLVWGRRFSLKFGIGMALAIVGSCTLGVKDYTYKAMPLPC